jgi:hypothetical protein
VKLDQYVQPAAAGSVLEDEPTNRFQQLHASMSNVLPRSLSRERPRTSSLVGYHSSRSASQSQSQSQILLNSTENVHGYNSEYVLKGGFKMPKRSNRALPLIH